MYIVLQVLGTTIPPYGRLFDTYKSMHVVHVVWIHVSTFLHNALNLIIIILYQLHFNLLLLHYFPSFFLSLFAAPDAPPSNFSVTDIGSTYIQFFWNPPPSEFQNGPIVSYTLNCVPATPGLSLPLTYYLQNESFKGNGGLEDNVTTFMPGTMYKCFVLATNAAGDSPLAIINVTTLELSKL